MNYTHGGGAVPFLRMERPCSCTCCCLNRPVLFIHDGGSGELLGSLSDPCTCCNLVFMLRDGQGNDVLRADGGCCQWGLCCPMPCGPCATVEFPVSDARTVQQVAHIQKKVPSCMTWCFASDVDNYKIEFGGVQSPQYKALLMALAIFIDFR